MLAKKYLVAITVIIIAICVYFLSTNTQTQASLLQTATQLPIEDKDALPTKSIIDNQQYLPEDDDLPIATCEAFEQAQQINNTNQSRFIRAKAMQWYFDGHDKIKIAETLAATFGYSTATNWIKSIESISRYTDNYNKLTQTIDSLGYSSNLKKRQTYLYPLSRFQQSNEVEGLDSDQQFNIEQRLNEYPDIAIHHWKGALKHALKYNEFNKATDAIKALKSYVKNPFFVHHPLRDIDINVSLTSFTEQETERIVVALFELSPLFFEENSKNARYFKQRLLGLNIEESLWKIEYVSADDFNVDPTINALIEQVKIAYPSFTSTPQLAEFCNGENQASEINKIKTTKISSEKSKQTLPPAWQGVKALHCPDRTATSSILKIIRELNRMKITINDLSDFQGLQKYSNHLKSVLTKLDEFDRSIFFSMLYHGYRDEKLNINQINTLIGDGLTPANSDFYYLISHLPFEQQKQLLIEHQYTLSPFNGTDSSMILNAIDSTETNDEILPFLLSQGFVLKKDEASPDPLWLQLLYMQGRYNGDNKYVLPIKTISSLIEHSQLTEVHIDAMYKIKQKNPALYEQLISEFPELNFTAPKALIEISCD